VPLKESCVVFIIWEHIIVVFSFDALFGLTWRTGAELELESP
jgi:hypothetical protein